MKVQRYYKTSKYKNTKTIIDGIKFDSRKEANRYCELKLLLNEGVIKDLHCQVSFELQPKFRNQVTGRVERAITYVADFVYIENGKVVIEDVKGFRTDVYKIKRKMMEYQGHHIVEL